MKTIAVFCVLMASAVSGPVEKQFDWANVSQSDFTPQGINASVKPQIEERISGGTIAIPHQFPYQVGLMLTRINGTGEKTSWCGGTLISNLVILTAGHCLQSQTEAIVLLGAQALQEEDDRDVLVVDDTDFIIHPQFNANNAINDIGLIILPEKVVLNKYIQTVNLPQPSQDQSSLVNKLAVIAGWGRTGDNRGISMQLHYATLKILPEAPCNETYPDLFKTTQICVSAENKKSVCPGDSGGPLVVEETDGSKTVVGLVSFGKREGCELGYPTVFTRVASYLDWIEESVGVSPKMTNNNRLNITFL